MDAVSDPLLAAWQTNHRITLFLLDAISEAGLRCTLSTRGGRDVARPFAHLHDVRVWALQRRARDLAEGLVPFASKDSPERAVVRAALEASGVAVGRFLVDLRDGRPKRRGFSKGWETHLSYFVAHESHHRGSILLTLKVSGHAEPKEVANGILSWDTM